MPKPNFRRFKRNYNDNGSSSSSNSQSPKRNRKNTHLKGQSTISKFFVSASQVANEAKLEKLEEEVIDDGSKQADNNAEFQGSSKPLSVGTMNKLGKFRLENVSNQEIDFSLMQQAVDRMLDIGTEKHESSESKPGNSICYTKFEKQFLELKSKHPDKILLVESGYKYKFLGDDAQVASDVLNIMATKDHNFLNASIPTHRLHVHVRRLVEHGYKVGVVKQTETTALKKIKSVNKSDLFERELSAVYTKSTLLGEDVDVGEIIPQESTVCSMACLMEMAKHDKQSYDMGIVILEPATGDAIYDSFVDKLNRSELEKILVHCKPVEVIVPQNISNSTEQLLLSRSLRIEKLPNSCFLYSDALSMASEFVNETVFQDFSPCVVSALGALIKYLKEFGLAKALSPQRLKRFTTFPTFLQMDAATVRNLEIFETSNNKFAGSLCWVLDQTKTSFGSRLFRRWLSQPLHSLELLLERQEAVTELLRPELSAFVAEFRNFLSKLPDIEKELTCVLHGKIKPAAFYSLVSSLSEIYQNLKSKEIEIWSLFTNAYIETAFSDIASNLEGIDAFKENLDMNAAKEGKKTNLLKDWNNFPNVIAQREAIDAVTRKLNDLRPSIAKRLGMLMINYVTVSGAEFLIEINNKIGVKIPQTWEKVSSTQKVDRYRPPEVQSLYAELCRNREMLNVVCQEAWLTILQEFSQKYHTYKHAVANLAILDALISLAEISKQDGFCRPALQVGKPLIEIKKGSHPILHHTSRDVVANDTYLGEPHERCMIVTGPNMGGKSCYLRQVAMLVVMAQMGCYIPAESATINLVDAIFIRMGSRDELQNRRSTLFVELDEAGMVLKYATSSSLAILDELGRGTSTCDGAAIAMATLQHIITKVKCLTLFVTHYPIVMTLEQQFPKLAKNYHLSFEIVESSHSKTSCGETLIFLYELTEGGAHHSFGLNVARLANLPGSIIAYAETMAQRLQSQVVTSSQYCKKLLRICNSVDAHQLRQAVLQT